MQNENQKIRAHNAEHVNAAKGELVKAVTVLALSGMSPGSVTIAMAEVFGSLIASSAKQGELEHAIETSALLVRVTALETNAKLAAIGLR